MGLECYTQGLVQRPDFPSQQAVGSRQLYWRQRSRLRCRQHCWKQLFQAGVISQLHRQQPMGFPT